MKISVNWLNQLFENPLVVSCDEGHHFAERISRTSVEAEWLPTLAQGQSGIVVAKVLSVVPHPDSDHMAITMVDCGAAAPVQIVTGAPNVAVNQHVILATVGAQIRDRETGELVTLARVKLRGYDSDGMLVALQEIGFPDQLAPQDFAEGIYVFPENDPTVVPGADALALLGMHESVIETDLTPNRSDMLSLVGTAYEIGAMVDQKVTLPAVPAVATSKPVGPIQVLLAAESAVTSYYSDVLTKVTVTASPLWLQRTLWLSGIKPVNVVTDIANYLMLLYGQPVMAYDADCIHGDTVTVRYAQAGEQFVAADGTAYTLVADKDLVVADDQQILGLPGIATGQAAAVTATTTRVIFESARYQSTVVRLMAQRHHLHTEASTRMERGIDSTVGATVLAAARQLLATCTTGVAVTETLSCAKTPVTVPTTVTISEQRINRLLGTALSAQDICCLLTRLGFSVLEAAGKLTVTVPSHRCDVTMPADVVEEVARLYGYDNLPTCLPTHETTTGQLTPEQRQYRASRQVLENLGLTQAISYTLTTAGQAQQFTIAPATGEAVTLAYPLSSERTTARQSLIPGLLDDVRYNAARSVSDVALYEQGRVFLPITGTVRPKEVMHVAGVLTGNQQTSTWQAGHQAVAVDFYTAKGCVEQYCAAFGLVAAVTYVATDARSDMHPGRTADIWISGQCVGFVGQVHPQVTRQAKLPAVYVFEIDLEALMAKTPGRVPYQPVSRFPKIDRDIALLVPETVTHAAVQEVIASQGGDYLATVTLFDRYVGDELPAGFKSLAYTLTYQDAHSTLIEAVVTAAYDELVAALVTRLGAQIR